jgi:PmbA protein
MPLTEERSREAAEVVLDHRGPDAIQLVIAASTSGVTRYANSRIIQNLARRELRAYVRAFVGGSKGSAVTNQLDSRHLRETADRAVEIAKASRPDPDWPGLPQPSNVGRARPVLRLDEDTLSAAPRKRAEAVQEMLRASEAENAAGVFETSAHAYAVYSSTGIACYDSYSRCVASCLVDLGDSTGWGDASSHAVGDVDVAAIGKRARAKADAGRNPLEAKPGEYEVVLESRAVFDLVDYLSYCGFGAKQVLEGESFLAAKAGTKVAAPCVTISDDVWHPQSVGIGFDLEGVPKQAVDVIREGVARAPVTDWKTAKQLGIASTGHSSGSDEFGPYAANTVLASGQHSLE